MPRVNLIQPSFTSGEVSPLIAGRVDAKVYANGLRTCKNFIVRPQGALSFRTGTKFGDLATRSETLTKLVPFRYSDTDAFQIELGDYFLRILRNGVPVLNSTSMFSAISAVANSGGQVRATFSNNNRIVCVAADNGAGLIRVTTTLPHNLVSGDRLYFTPEFGSFIVAYISPTVLDLVGSTYAGPYGGTNYIVTSNLISGSSNSGGRIKVTTYLPHKLDTDDKVYMAHTGPGVDFSGSPATFDWFVEVVDDTSFILAGSVYTAGSDAFDDVFANWIRNGQRLVVTGSGGSQNLAGEWRAIQSTTRDFIVFANSVYVGATAGSYNLYFSHIKLDTPWADTELAEIRFAQSADVLYLLHPDHSPRKLVRFSDDSWSLQEIDFKDGPYLPLNDSAPHIDATTPENGTRYDDVYLELSSYAHTATVKSAVAFAAAAADQNKYLEYRDGDQWRLAKLTSASSSSTTGTVDIIDNVLLHLDETVKFKNTVKSNGILGGSKFTYDAGSPNASPSVPGAGVQKRVDPNNHLMSGATTAAGTLTSNYSNTFGVADLGKFVRFFDNTAVGASTGPLPRWAIIKKINALGNSAAHAAAVAMCGNNSTGNFVITNHSRTATLKSYRAGVAFTLFRTTDVGRHVRLGYGGRWTWGIITAVDSGLAQVSITLYEDVPRDPQNAANLAGATVGSVTYNAAGEPTGLSAGRTYDWRLGAWSGTTGYPSVAGFHEQRLVFGRTDTQPSTFWGSVTGDFENMRPTELDSTVQDDNAINFTLASGRVNAIKWIESGVGLVLGTNGGEWLVRSSSVAQEPITPTNIAVIEQSRYGSSRTAEPIRIGTSIVFVDRSEQKVLEVAYLYSEDRLAAKDLTIVGEHVLRNGGTVVQTAFQQNPSYIGWFLLSNGTLAALTYNTEQEVIAWHRHEIGGTDAVVESICVTPSADGTSDVLYMVVNRHINGPTKRSIELLTPEFYPSGATRTGMTFLDGLFVATVGTVAGAYTLKGLYHLENEHVTIMLNGVIYDTTMQVLDASVPVTLLAANTEIVVGLPYTAMAKSLPPEGGSPSGTSQGMKKRIVEMKVRVNNSMGFNFGWQSDLVAKDLSALTTVRTETLLPFFTGTIPVVPKNPYDEESPWTITQDKPYPLNVLAVVNVVETSQ